jgi:hypothetical protein
MQYTIDARHFFLFYDTASCLMHVTWPHGTPLTSMAIRPSNVPSFMHDGVARRIGDIHGASSDDANLLAEVATAADHRLDRLRSRHRWSLFVAARWPHQVHAGNPAAFGSSVRPGLRHNMIGIERRELAQQVRDGLAASGRRDRARITRAIACDLNDWAADRSILNRLPDFDDGARLVHAQCGHFSIASDLERGTGHTHCCRDCLESGDYVRTEDTEELIPRGDAIADDDGLHYASAPDDDDDGGGDGDDEPDGDGVYQWSTDTRQVLRSPEIQSTAAGDFTLGVEFECVTADSHACRELATHVNEDLSGDVMCKEDGSLPPNGIELVFAPLVLESVRATFDRIRFPDDTQAWSAGCCGLHVHIDARAFTRLSLAKFIAFWNAPGNANFIRSVTGRHPLQDEQARAYANTVELNTPVEIIQDIKSGTLTYSRYRAVNLTPLGPAAAKRLGVTFTDGHRNQYNTVELRLFRASMKRERTLAHLDMAHATVEFARHGSVCGMAAKHFIEWLRRGGQRYPHLRAWLGIARAHHPHTPDRITEAETA